MPPLAALITDAYRTIGNRENSARAAERTAVPRSPAGAGGHCVHYRTGCARALFPPCSARAESPGGEAARPAIDSRGRPLAVLAGPGPAMAGTHRCWRSTLLAGVRTEVKSGAPLIKASALRSTTGMTEFREASVDVDVDAVARMVTYPSSHPRHLGESLAQ